MSSLNNVAVVSVQAGLADHLFVKEPEAARQALHQVQKASGAILDELAGILSVLRDPDEESADSSPAPGLNLLTELVDSYTEAGLPVEISRSGQPRDLSPSADLVAYRVVQESLTNAHKHGGSRAQVVVAYTADGVVLDVVNPLRSPVPSPSPGGYGIQGMRERAAAVGGNLRVEPEAEVNSGSTWPYPPRFPSPRGWFCRDGDAGGGRRRPGSDQGRSVPSDRLRGRPGGGG